MDFDDSFFDEHEGKKKSAKHKEKVEYHARRCEMRWFVPERDSSSGISNSKQENVVPEHFMLLKYRADLLYYQKDYQLAAKLYEDTLEILPQISSLVKREIIDSLTRCHLHLEEYASAKRSAEQLVLPPHDSDSSSWKLKSLCYTSLQETEAQVLSLQKCITLQCHHATYWLELADGYNRLSQSPPFTASTVEHDGTSEPLQHILQNTVSLFRPHFSWRGKLQSNAMDNNPGMDQERLCDQKETDSVLVGTTSTKPSSAGDDESMKCCFFYRLSQNNSHHLSDITGSLLCFCPLHPFFAVLVSRMLSVEEFVRMLKDSAKSGTTTGREYLGTIYSWARCSCFIIARHLLVYSVKCSNSFAKESQSDKLKRVEQLLSDCDEDTRSFLETCFNQRSIFDDCRT